MDLSELKYTETHEWVHKEANLARIGITDFAQGELGDIVFVELPQVGDTVTKGAPFCTVESVKAVSDTYAPVSGTVKEVNAVVLVIWLKKMILVLGVTPAQKRSTKSAWLVTGNGIRRRIYFAPFFAQ